MRANLDLLTNVSPWYRIIFNILNEIFPQDPDRAAALGDLASQREDGAGPAESGRDQQAEAAGGGPGQTWQVNTLSDQSYCHQLESNMYNFYISTLHFTLLFNWRSSISALSPRSWVSAPHRLRWCWSWPSLSSSTSWWGWDCSSSWPRQRRGRRWLSTARTGSRRFSLLVQRGNRQRYQARKRPLRQKINKTLMMIKTGHGPRTSSINSSPQSLIWTGCHHM